MTVESENIKHSVVETLPLLRPIERGDSLVMLGSCFAQYMGERMAADGFEVMVNPLGTLFNPFSIAATVRTALDEDAHFPLFAADGEWRCWLANTHFRASTPEELAGILKERYSALRDALLTARHLVLTLGTNVCYRTDYADPSAGGSVSDIVVTNCQRQPDRLFREWRASLGEVTDELQDMLNILLERNPSLQVILTVSPYRYHKYGYHGSQLSKATLLLAEEQLARLFPCNCCYFPAYEILLDELRDYRFYAPDGHHPGDEAVDVIWERFSKQIK